MEPTPPAQAEPLVLASPVHAGCYQVRRDRCRIHVEPFTINIATGRSLAHFQLLATNAGTNKVIYDWKPDLSNPVSGTTYTPTKLAKDFAATCGKTYTVSLLGQDSGDAAMLILGTTAQFSCPKATYLTSIPLIKK